MNKAEVYEVTSRLSPVRITEVVLKTVNLERLRDWYVAAVGAKPSIERTPPKRSGDSPASYLRAADMRICFITLNDVGFPYVQVLAIFEVPTLGDPTESAPGMHHLQLRGANLAELIQRYDALKAAGITPFRTANHGLGTSFYYRDPDHNIVEFSAANFATWEETVAFRSSEAFRKNPSGAELDIDDFVRRFKAGVPTSELLRLPNPESDA